jgi:hypothetical protein
MEADMLATQFISALALIAAAALAGTGAAQAKDPPIECEVRTKQGAGSVELEAVVRADAPGSYEFSVVKHGAGGSSTTAQSGDFESSAGEQVVGTVQLGLDRASTYSAELTVKWQGGETACANQPGTSL